MGGLLLYLELLELSDGGWDIERHLHLLLAHTCRVVKAYKLVLGLDLLVAVISNILSLYVLYEELL